MNPAALDLLTPALWVAAALVAAGVCLPMLLASFGLTRLQIKTIAGPEAVESLDHDPRFTSDRCDRLRALGFEPTAVRVERRWFYFWQWVRTSLPSSTFARPGRDCFAVLFRIYRGDPWRLAFSTILTDGTLVATADQTGRLRIDRPGYWRCAYATEDVAELLDLHEQTVAGFRVRGWTVATPTLEEAREIGARRAEDYLRDVGQAKSLRRLRSALTDMALGALAAGLVLGFGHWAVPLAFMAGGLVYELVMAISLRAATERIRRQDQDDALGRRMSEARRGRRAIAEPEYRGTGEESVLPAEQRRQASERLRMDPPPLPPTDLTLPPEW